MDSIPDDDTTHDDENLKTFFLQEKPTDMLVCLKRQGESYASELSTKVSTTYSHAVKVMNRMQDQGLVESEKKGRKKEYTLTEKGETVAEGLLTLFDEVEGFEIEGDVGDTKFGLDKIKQAR